jgi:hypothetical protein
VKRKSGRLSPDQEAFSIGAKAAGGEYYVVHSVDEVRQLGL